MLGLLVILVLAPAARANEANDVPGLLQAKEELRRPADPNANDTILETYQKAVQAYLDEDWDACIQGFRDLIHKYKKYKNTVIKCRRQCREDSEKFKPIFHENIEDLHFYEKKVKETLCLLNCNQEYRERAGKKSLKRLPKKEEWKLITADHFQYLHNCYYQKKYYQEAANAVFTYLIYHPDHKPSKTSLTYYMNLPQVNNKTIRNLQAEPFVIDYMKGVKAYEEKYYEEAISWLEDSFQLYIKSEEQCRFYCEGPFEQGWNPDFTISISNHFVYNLQCKRRCSRILNTLNSEYRNDFLANHFNYLQFAYYKIGDIKHACEAVENYLLFYPADHDMLTNKNFYLSLPKVEPEYFKPREIIVNYVKRQEYELHLLVHINEEFNAFEDKVNALETMVWEHLQENENQDSAPSETRIISLNNRIFGQTKKGPYFVASKETLGGKYRFLTDGVIEEDECDFAIQLAEMTSWEGDGYEGYKSPHSEFERFEGVTIGRLAVLTYFGLLDPNFLELLLKITETARSESERILTIDQHLYITYTHLVCRTALPDSPENRSDYSHQIHADNCLLEDDGTCRSESPAYFYRDYSSILYLNSDFDGGDFIFVRYKNASFIESTVRPKCGRMLSFASGGDNLHGVTAVTKGKRCALGLWFTLKPKYEDLDRALARYILGEVAREGASEAAEDLDNIHSYNKYKTMLVSRFLKTRIKIT